jgi:hypothetical protein
VIGTVHHEGVLCQTCSVETRENLSDKPVDVFTQSEICCASDSYSLLGWRRVTDISVLAKPSDRCRLVVHLLWHVDPVVVILEELPWSDERTVREDVADDGCERTVRVRIRPLLKILDSSFCHQFVVPLKRCVTMTRNLD